MQTLFLLSLCAATSFGAPKSRLLGCKFIAKRVNKEEDGQWEASPSLNPSTSPELTVRSFDLDAESTEAEMDEYNQLEDVEGRAINFPLPEYYDARQKYEHCYSLQRVEDQGCGCRASWAIAPVSALTDRYCIYYNGDIKPDLSAANVLSCCPYCTQGQGCEGGLSLWAWSYLQHSRVPTGDMWGVGGEGCQNYQIAPCDFKPSIVPLTPMCQKYCDNGAEPLMWYSSRKSYIHRNTTIQAIQRDIFENGPVTSDMSLFEDFFCYRSGVYTHLYGEQISVQTVKLIGWGKEEGVDYWLAANSWGQDWGEDGFFKIERGNNECNIEYLIISGLIQPVMQQSRPNNQLIEI